MDIDGGSAPAGTDASASSVPQIETCSAQRARGRNGKSSETRRYMYEAQLTSGSMKS